MKKKASLSYQHSSEKNSNSARVQEICANLGVQERQQLRHQQSQPHEQVVPASMPQQRTATSIIDLDLPQALMFLSSLMMEPSSQHEDYASAKKSSSFAASGNSNQSASGWLFFILLFSAFFPIARAQVSSGQRYMRTYGDNENVTLTDMVMTSSGPVYAGMRMDSNGTAKPLIMQADENGIINSATQWGGLYSVFNVPPNFTVNKLIKKSDTSVFVLGYGDNGIKDISSSYRIDAAFVGQFSLSTKRTSSMSWYPTIKLPTMDEQSLICKTDTSGVISEEFCLGTDKSEQAIIGHWRNGTIITTTQQWTRNYKPVTGGMFLFQDLSFSPNGLHVLVIGITNGFGLSNKEYYIMKLDKISGDVLNFARTALGGQAKMPKITYKPDGQNFIAAVTTDRLSNFGDDTLLIDMKADFSSITWSGLLQQRGHNKLTQMNIDSNNRVILSGYVIQHPSNNNELAEFVMIGPDKVLKWAHYLSTSTHTRGQAIAFSNDGNALYLAGYGLNTTTNRRSMFVSRIAVNDTLEIGNCLDLSISLPNLVQVNTVNLLQNVNNTLSVTVDTLDERGVDTSSEVTVILQTTTHCQGVFTGQPAMTLNLSSTSATPTMQSNASPTTISGITLTSSPDGTQNVNNSVTGSSVGTQTSSPANESTGPMPITNMTGDGSNVSTVFTPQNLERSPSLSSGNNSVLYITIGVLGGVVLTILAGVGFTFFIKRKHHHNKNANVNEQASKGSHQDMYSARVSDRYDHPEQSAVLEAGSDRSDGKSRSQYDVPPPPQYPAGTMSNGNVAAASPVPSAPQNTYDIVPSGAVDDYTVLEKRPKNQYHVPGVKSSVVQQATTNNQYTATTAQSSMNQLPRNHYDGVDVPLDPSSGTVSTMTQRVRTQSDLVAKDDAKKGLAADHYNSLGVLGTDTLAKRASGHTTVSPAVAVDPVSNIGYAQSTKN